MNTTAQHPANALEDKTVYGPGEKLERRALGLPACEPAPTGMIKRLPKGRPVVKKTASKAPEVLNEACEYGSAFTRGLRIDLPGGITHLLFSGTASVGPQ